MNAALLIDKPAGMTSHDVVSVVRRITHQRRIGHIGTLDPFATGLLVLLLGKATRLTRFFDQATKSYEAVMRVGFATDSFDLTGKPVGPDRGDEFRPQQVESLIKQFEGSSFQRPPAFSAKKISGVPAYKKARKGQEVQLAPVSVAISQIALEEIKDKLIKFSVTVSSGTYIRSIANDLGERLAIGGHLTELRRTAVGAWQIHQALSLETVQVQLSEGKSLGELMIPMESLLPEIPARQLAEAELSGVLHGRSVQAAEQSRWLRLVAPDGRLAAVAAAEGGGSYHPEVVLLDAVPADDLNGLTQAGDRVESVLPEATRRG